MLGQEKILTLYSILLFFKFSRVIFFKVNFLKNSKLFVKKKNIFFRKKIKNNFFSFNYKLVSSDIFSLFKFYKNTNLRLIFFNKRINFYFCKSSFKTLNFNFFKSNLRKNSKNLNMLHMKKKNILNKIFFKNALKFFFLKKKHKKFDKKKTFIFSKVLSKRYKFKWWSRKLVFQKFNKRRKFYKSNKFKFLFYTKKKYIFKNLIKKSFVKVKFVKFTFIPLYILSYLQAKVDLWFIYAKKKYNLYLKSAISLIVKINDYDFLIYFKFKSKRRLLYNFKNFSNEISESPRIFMKKFWKAFCKTYVYACTKFFKNRVNLIIHYKKSAFKYREWKTINFIKFRFLLLIYHVIKYFIKINNKKPPLFIKFVYNMPHANLNEKVKKIRRK